ncbi:VOC family protein [Roseateles sp. NT4]|uniref:VOC family protein n=1 Tax=Roseateles sp. NT4 TaxID=3453715 RepID=UPI003EEE1193
MKLNHVDFPVPDVAETAAFFEKFFGFTQTEMKRNAGLAVLHGSDGFELVLTRFDHDLSEYPKTFHIGFLLPTQEAVTCAYERLVRGGHQASNRPRVMRGTFLFYCRAPGGLLIEIGHRPSSAEIACPSRL